MGMDANLPSSPSSIHGYSSLKKGDQKKVDRLWKAMFSTNKSEGGKKRPLASDSGGSKRAKKGDLAALTSPQGVLSKKEYKKLQAEEENASSLKVAQLRRELDLNNQVRHGKKEEMVHRV